MSSLGWFDAELLPLSIFDAEIDPLAWFDRNIVGFDDRVRISQSFLSWFDGDFASRSQFDADLDPLHWFGDEGGPDDFPTLTALKLSVWAASPYAGSPFYNFGSGGGSTTRRLVYRLGSPAPTVGTAVNGRPSAYYDSTATDAFDPTTLAWSLAFRGSYGGAPWAATATAGSSALYKLDTFGFPAPTSQVNLNGYSAPDFDPLDVGGVECLKAFTTGGAAIFLSDVITRTAFYGAGLVRHRSSAAPAGNIYDNACIVADDGGNYGVAVCTIAGVGKVAAWFYDDATFADTGWITLPLGTDSYVEWWYDGVNLHIRVNGTTTASVAKASVTTAYNTIVVRVGVGASAVGFDGRVQDLWLAASDLSANGANMILEADARYAISL